jgi:hypothetical protein
MEHLTEALEAKVRLERGMPVGSIAGADLDVINADEIVDEQIEIFRKQLNLTSEDIEEFLNTIRTSDESSGWFTPEDGFPGNVEWNPYEYMSSFGIPPEITQSAMETIADVYSKGVSADSIVDALTPFYQRYGAVTYLDVRAFVDETIRMISN